MCMGILSIVLSGCKTMPKPESTYYQPIAWFVPNALNSEQLENYLMSNHIECAISGSRSFQVEVPRSMARKATDLLRNSEFGSKLSFYKVE
jgi:hypothetical protein